MIENCLPPAVRGYYIRVRAQKWEDALAKYRHQLTELRCENAARSPLVSGPQILAEWKLSEEFIGEMANGLLQAALTACELYAVPLDGNLSNCIESEVKGFLESQFRNSIRMRDKSRNLEALSTNMRGALEGRIPGAKFKILNPIQIRLEEARVKGITHISTKPKGSNEIMPLALSSSEEIVLKALGEVYPDKVHVGQLASTMGEALQRHELLRTLERLHTRGLVECVPLKDSGGFVDAANIVLSAQGKQIIEQSPSQFVSQPIKATVLNALIASPSDVAAERDAVEAAIHEWTANHHVSTGIVLHPVRWETHSYPAMGDRPQAIVNKQIVKSAHFLIGIFGSRLGTPTGAADSGTLEEIEEFRKTGRHVALYFSTAPVPRDADRTQLEALERYKATLQTEGIVFTFGSVDELRRLVTSHLPRIVAEVAAKLMSDGGGSRAQNARAPKEQPAEPKRAVLQKAPPPLSANGELDPKEIELLWTASRSSNGEILHSVTLDGEDIRANDRHFLLNADRRTVSEWLSALRGLEARGFVEALSEDRDFFRLTGEGYSTADELDEFARWDAQSVILRAYYVNADTNEITLSCSGVVALPTTYYPDQISGDRRFVQRSIKEPRTLLVEGLQSKPTIAWQPNAIEFVDLVTGKAESFRIDGMEYSRPGQIKLPIDGV
jgi:hypothetical protein